MSEGRPYPIRANRRESSFPGLSYFCAESRVAQKWPRIIRIYVQKPRGHRPGKPGTSRSPSRCHEPLNLFCHDQILSSCIRTDRDDLNPCTGAQSATSHGTSVAANRPGCRSSPGGPATRLGGLFPTGRPSPASLQADRFTTALRVQGRVREGVHSVVRIKYIDVLESEPGTLIHSPGGAVGPFLDLVQIFLCAALPEIVL
jgi:hypothetical protein